MSLNRTGLAVYAFIFSKPISSFFCVNILQPYISYLVMTSLHNLEHRQTLCHSETLCQSETHQSAKNKKFSA